MVDLLAKSIKLQTRKGNNIDNIQSFEWIYDKTDVMVYEMYKEKVTFRSDNSSIYNCHGMVFAARRTNIDDPNEVRKILIEDDYEEVSLEDILPGDIVTYIDSNGNMDHSAMVIESPSEKTANMPLVVSKWGRFREAIHLLHQCPYPVLEHKYFRIKK